MAPALDPQNRRLVLKGRVPNPDRRLMPGMFANIRVEAAKYEKYFSPKPGSGD